ncbi:COG4705 family protein [Jatrophihabitans sp. DSM 45814]
MRASVDAPRSRREPVAAKVPEITAFFWVIKVLTTGMGEAASDYLGNKNLVLAGAVGVLGFVFAMWLQFRTTRYQAAVYWFAVMMVAVFGTMAADGLHVGLGVPYVVTTIFYSVAVAVVFYLWYRSEGTLSIHSITTRRRETYYWVTVLATFALGTAAGDLTAVSMNLGFFASGLLFAVVMAVPAIGWWRFNLNPIFAFWFAYVVTRPLGASFADWLGKEHSVGGGLDYGDGMVTIVATVVIALLVAYVAVTKIDIQPARAAGLIGDPVASPAGD